MQCDRCGRSDAIVASEPAHHEDDSVSFSPSLTGPIHPSQRSYHTQILCLCACVLHTLLLRSEKGIWRLPGDGIYSTAVGYCAGFTPNPTYEEACSGRTGHTEGARVVYDPEKVTNCTHTHSIFTRCSVHASVA